MADALHAAAAWLFFADYPLSPLAIYGAGVVGWYLHAWTARRHRKEVPQ